MNERKSGWDWAILLLGPLLVVASSIHTNGAAMPMLRLDMTKGLAIREAAIRSDTSRSLETKVDRAEFKATVEAMQTLQKRTDDNVQRLVDFHMGTGQ